MHITIQQKTDMFFKRKTNETSFFAVWSLLNQWIGVVACAIAFCSIAPDFAEICKSYSNQINIVLFVSAISCVLKEMAALIVVSVVTAAVTKANSKEINSVRNVYLGRLENSDASIQNAMKYLKLTNGIKQLNGEKK